MEIKMTINLHMTDADLHAWANEYGLSMDEVASDASGHLGELVQATIANISQVKDFTSITRFAVK